MGVIEGKVKANYLSVCVQILQKRYWTKPRI